MISLGWHWLGSMPSTSVAVRWHGGPSCDMFLEHLCLVWSQNWDCKVVQPPSVLLWSRTKHCQLFFDYQILPWWKAGNTLSPILAGVPCRLANSLACQSQSIPAPNWEIIRKCTGATSMAYLNSRAQTVLYCFILFLDAQNADVHQRLIALIDCSLCRTALMRLQDCRIPLKPSKHIRWRQTIQKHCKTLYANYANMQTYIQHH